MWHTNFVVYLAGDAMSVNAPCCVCCNRGVCGKGSALCSMYFIAGEDSRQYFPDTTHKTHAHNPTLRTTFATGKILMGKKSFLQTFSPKPALWLYLLRSMSQGGSNPTQTPHPYVIYREFRGQSARSAEDFLARGASGNLKTGLFLSLK